MYVSETKFAVRSAVEQPMGIDIASQLFKTASTSVQDARIVDAYLRSPDVFEQLDGELQLTKHYSDSSRDPVSRLASSPTLWDKESFWQRVAQPKIDVDSGIVTLRCVLTPPTWLKTSRPAFCVRAKRSSTR